MQTRISKWGNSLGVRIPKAFAAEAGLDDGTAVDISVSAGKIVVTPLGREYKLEELVERITPENRHSETDWGEPAGGEVW
jgi:antitoxin MazE